jgi:predicted enzyme related to lactoylglutathione lyase
MQPTDHSNHAALADAANVAPAAPVAVNRHPQEAAMLQKCPMYAYIPAKDVNRARRFYEEKLGLQPGDEMEGGVAYEFGDHTGAILYDAGDSAGTSKASQAYWKVDDLEREMAQLRARGIQFEEYEPEEVGGVVMKDGIAVGGGSKAAWFKDSEGNIMALVQELDS